MFVDNLILNYKKISEDIADKFAAITDDLKYLATVKCTVPYSIISDLHQNKDVYIFEKINLNYKLISKIDPQKRLTT